MHNIKKTPASEIYDAIAEKKREEKKRVFLEMRDQIFDKRDRGEYA